MKLQLNVNVAALVLLLLIVLLWWLCQQREPEPPASEPMSIDTHMPKFWQDARPA
jgi:hypothetical protein